MIATLDIEALSSGYADGSLTPEMVLETIYQRIARMGERPVWIALVPHDQALAKLRDTPKGPLWGIPFAVKDNIDVAGMPTTAGCPDFAYTPSRSAHVVERLQAAGAILIGKTNLDQFATGLVGTRSPYGICSSVFSSEHISGGSSAGSAVAVGAGLVSFSLGTDTAGSGRVPAAFNNIVGLKPTKGLISTSGVVPACRTQDCVSVFAGTVADAVTVLRSAGGYDPDDPYSRREKSCSDDIPAGFRFGVPSGTLEFFGDGATASLFDQTVARLESLGGTRVEIDFQPFDEAARLLYAGPWVAERLAAIRDFARTHAQSIHEVVRGIILGGDRFTAIDGFEGAYRLAALIRRAETEWAKMELMILPTTGTTYRIDEVLADPLRLNSNLGRYTNFVNLMDLSAIAVPAGFRPNGLPFGVTLIGRAFADEPLARVADRLHRTLPDAVIGATGRSLAMTPGLEPRAFISSRRPIAPSCPDKTIVAVVGAHLAGQPLHSQLEERHAHFLGVQQTSPGYSLYALPGATPAKPGLVFDGKGAGAIEVELYEMDMAAFGSFVALIPPPLGIGTVCLASNRQVKGFLCESHAVAGADDITAYGGWRAWLGRKTNAR
ncbi:allophanate hydrolase [Telmatospirillum sp.]|uniref:allophanate hydrolase n=1 Tax=Telmatospirillum sp. TaxID=2079197 RepID=UPI002851621A|nr:allophanate hydrolase [Telmatospirillum sp.]MDR3436751.1 allophanate hydrolase [Telmatospirillum sp.]